MVTTPGQALLLEAGAPDWMQRYHLRLVEALGQCAAVDLSNIVGASLPNFADDTSAAAGGVAIGQPYLNGSIFQIRVV